MVLELNPVRTNMVSTPEQYQWSSFYRNGQEKDDLVSPHNLYQKLGKIKTRSLYGAI